MNFTESIDIAATPERVWPYLANPVLMATWNKKIVDVKRSGADAPVQTGDTYTMTFRMSERDDESSVEVLESDPRRRLRIRHEHLWKNKIQTCLEYYDLEALNPGSPNTATSTRVHQELTITGLPWIACLLIKFIDRFGTSEGFTSLQKLKHVVEADADRSPPP